MPVPFTVEELCSRWTDASGVPYVTLVRQDDGRCDLLSLYGYVGCIRPDQFVDQEAYLVDLRYIQSLDRFIRAFLEDFSYGWGVSRGEFVSPSGFPMGRAITVRFRNPADEGVGAPRVDMTFVRARFGDHGDAGTAASPALQPRVRPDNDVSMFRFCRYL